MAKVGATQYLQHALYLEKLLSEEQKSATEDTTKLADFATMRFQEETVITATSCATKLIWGLANFRALMIISPLSREETGSLSAEENAVMASRASMNAVASAASVFLLVYSAAKIIDWYFEIGVREEKINTVAQKIFTTLASASAQNLKEIFLRQMNIYQEECKSLHLVAKEYQKPSKVV